MLKNSLFDISPQIKSSYDLMCQKYQSQSFQESLEEAQNCLDLLEDQSQIMNPEEPINPTISVYKSFVYNKMAEIYLDLNNPSQAIMALVKAAKIEKSFEQDQETSKRLALIYTKIGKSCFYSCNYEMSYRYLQSAKQILEKSQGLNSPEMGMTYVQLGNYYRFMFQDDEAEEALKKSIEIRRNYFGEAAPEYAESLHGLAQLYADIGYIEKAMDLIDQTIRIYDNAYSRNHIKTAKSLYLKGNLYLRCQLTNTNLMNAEELISESLQINLQIVGEKFLETADCYHSLGKIKSQNHSSDEYIEYFIKALQILESLYGKAHACIAILLNNLGRAYYDRKKYEEAIQCFQRSIKIYQVICGNVHGNLAITLKSCADCHKHLGRTKQAHLNYLQSLQIYEQIETDFTYTKKQIQNFLMETKTED